MFCIFIGSANNGSRAVFVVKTRLFWYTKTLTNHTIRSNISNANICLYPLTGKLILATKHANITLTRNEDFYDE